MTSRASVLIIDDERQVLGMMRNLLKDCADEVFTADNGKSGIEIAVDKCDEIALIIVDMVMPEMTGPDVIRILKLSDASKIPKIVMTGSLFSKKETSQAYDAGAVDVLKKPFNLSILRAKVSAYMCMHRARNSCKLKEYSKENFSDPAIDTLHKLTDELDFDRVIPNGTVSKIRIDSKKGHVELHGLLNLPDDVAVSDFIASEGDTVDKVNAETEVAVVYKGSMEIEMQGKRRLVGRGECVYIEPHTPHIGNFIEDTRMIVITIPPSGQFPQGYANGKY